MPLCLEFLGTCTISSPSLTSVVCAHASGKQLDSIRTPTFQKSMPAFFKTTLSLTIDKKPFKLLLFHACFACHFSPAVSKNHWQSIRSRESNRGCIYCTQKNSKMSAVLQRTQSPWTCLLLYRAIDVHTSAPALLKLGTSNITESLLQMGYCYMKLIVIMTFGDR